MMNNNEVKAMVSERSGGLKVTIPREVVMAVQKEMRIAAETAEEAFETLAVPAMEGVVLALGSMGDLLSRPLRTRKGAAVALSTLVAAQFACAWLADRGLAQPTLSAKENNQPKPTVEARPTAVVVTPTVEVDPKAKSKFELNPLLGERLFEMSKEFAKGTLVFQTATYTEDGKTSLSEYPLENPGKDVRYSCIAAFEYKNTETGKITDTICAVRGSKGEEFFAIRMVNEETGDVEFIQTSEIEDPVYIVGMDKQFKSYIYWNEDGEGNAEYEIPIALQYDESGYTGKMVYGIDKLNYEVIELGEGFSAKNALLSPQLVAVMESVAIKMEEDGIEDYNFGFDFETTEFKIYGVNGEELGVIEGSEVHWANEVKMSPEDKQIFDAAPEIEGVEKVMHNLWGVVGVDENGEITKYLDYYEYNYDRGDWREVVREENGHLVILNAKGEEQIVYPERITLNVNGKEITYNTTARGYKENVTPQTPEEYKAVIEALAQAITEGRVLMPFAEGALTLTDLEKLDKYNDNATAKEVFHIRSDKWRELTPDQIPYSPLAFPYDRDGLAVEGVVIVPVMLLGGDGKVTGFWAFQVVDNKWMKFEPTREIQRLLDRDMINSGQTAMATPVVNKTIEACVKALDTPELDQVCSELFSQASAIETAFATSIASGEMSEDLVSGKLLPVITKSKVAKAAK